MLLGMGNARMQWSSRGSTSASSKQKSAHMVHAHNRTTPQILFLTVLEGLNRLQLIYKGTSLNYT